MSGHGHELLCVAPTLALSFDHVFLSLDSKQPITTDDESC